MEYDKPFKTYEELIEIMQSRHIIVDDKEFAIHALQNFSYYGIINGYKNTFLQIPGTNDFIKGTNFKELYTLHIIDTSLNNIIFKYIIYLERALKSRLSYLISENYGVYTDYQDNTCRNPNDYLYYKYYSNSNNKRINILRDLKNCISNKRHNPSMTHYITNKNHVPPWILTTNLSYGLTLEWYNILRSADKQKICDNFISPGLCSEEKTKEFVRKAFELTKEYRNKIAHGNRTFNIPSLPQIPKEQLLLFTFNAISEEEYDRKIGQSDTLAVLLVLITMLNDNYIITNLLSELYVLIKPYTKSYFNNKNIFEVLGFPDDLFERLEKLIKQKFS